MKKTIDLVVTRHQGLVDYLIEEGLIEPETRIVDHASEEDITGKHVLGVLPHNLSCLCNSFTEIPLLLPTEMRGKELSKEDVRKYAGELVTYKVTRINK